MKIEQSSLILSVFQPSYVMDLTSRYYNIEPSAIKSCTTFSILGNKATYTLVTDSKKYLVKISTFSIEFPNLRQVMEIEKIHNHLKKSNFKGSFPLKNLKNEYYTKIRSPEGTKFLTLYEFIEDKAEFRLTLGKAFEFGVTLGNLHIILDRIDSELKEIEKIDELDVVLKAEKIINEIKKEVIIDDLDMIYKIFDMLKTELPKLKEHITRSGLIYFNLAFNKFFDINHPINKEESSAGIHFLDLEDFKYGIKIWDIAKFSIMRSDTIHQSEGVKFEQIFSEFLRGYNSITLLSQREIAFIPMLEIIIHLKDICTAYELKNIRGSLYVINSVIYKMGEISNTIREYRISLT